jgi:hypothetical protein
VAGAAPEEPRAVDRAEMREVVDVVHGLDGHPRADPQPARFGAVADEAGAAAQLDQRDVKG